MTVEFERETSKYLLELSAEAVSAEDTEDYLLVNLAAKELARRHQDKLLRHISRNNFEDSGWEDEEIKNQTFIKARNSHESFTVSSADFDLGEKRFFSWLCTIARNHILDQRRKKRKLKKTHSEIGVDTQDAKKSLFWEFGLDLETEPTENRGRMLFELVDSCLTPRAKRILFEYYRHKDPTTLKVPWGKMKELENILSMKAPAIRQSHKRSFDKIKEEAANRGITMNIRGLK